MDGDRDLDVVVFGATGFAGRLVAAYLAGHAPAGTRIGLAGRSPARLAEVRAGLGEVAAGWPLRTADCAPRRAGGRGCGQIRPRGYGGRHPPAGCYRMRTILPSRWPCASRR